MCEIRSGSNFLDIFFLQKKPEWKIWHFFLHSEKTDTFCKQNIIIIAATHLVSSFISLEKTEKMGRDFRNIVKGNCGLGNNFPKRTTKLKQQFD